MIDNEINKILSITNPVLKSRNRIIWKISSETKEIQIYNNPIHSICMLRTVEFVDGTQVIIRSTKDSRFCSDFSGADLSSKIMGKQIDVSFTNPHDDVISLRFILN